MSLPALAAALLLSAPLGVFAARGPLAGTPQGARIVAIVGGEVITSGDVDNRARLFAVSSGLPPNPEVLDRL
ncbi:MAG: hypothetical protein M3Y41_09780, partial [Pseudomonadota bacterium]|nr:hypothetical protein [Pseudomonadota bacterium]